jgi:hypothetical protein
MKKLVLVAILIMLFFVPTTLVVAQSEDDDAGLPLCLPGMAADGTCMLYGPAQTVADMEAAGFSYPARDLPAAEPSSELGVLPIYVAKINAPEDEPAPIYASFDDAVARTNAIGQIDPGTLRYVSYISLAEHTGKTYLQLASGGWIKAAPAAYTDFQGLLFYEMPRNDFGWIVDKTPSYSEPTLSAATIGTYFREDVVQVYQTVEAEGLFWYQIAPEETCSSRSWLYMRMANCSSQALLPPALSLSTPDPVCSRSMKRSHWRPCKGLLRLTARIFIICRMCPGRCILMRPERCMLPIGALSSATHSRMAA